MQLDLELYREEVTVEPGVHISTIHIAPERPAQTLVFVHGFGGDARQWRYQIEQFAPRNRIIAMDLRGHGRSSWPSTGYSMAIMLADLAAVLDHLQVTEPFVLIGHSFGGAIVTDFAVAYPTRVSKLIMIASAGEYRLAPIYRTIFQLPDSTLRFLQPLAKKFIDASLLSLKQIYWHNLRHWQGWDKFPQLKPPTMVIMGNRDRVFPQAAFARVAELVPPESEIVDVGVSAHMVMLERRDAVNRAIERFMDTDTVVSRHLQWRSTVSGEGRGSLLAERPWLAHYESDVPPTIDVPNLPLTRLLDRAWRRFPYRPAIRFHGRTLSYRNLSAQAGRFANALQALGVHKGTRVMLLLPNVPQLVIAFYGILRLGGIAVMGNPQASRDEIVREAQLSGAEVLVTLTRLENTAQAVKAQTNVRHVIYTNVKDYLPFYRQPFFTLFREKREGHRLRQPLGPTDFQWRPLLRQYSPQPPKVEVGSHNTAVIQFTTGTTAEPKGVTLSHSNLVANTLQTRAWLPDARDGQEVILCVVPFSHVYGLTTGMNVAISIGASMILLPTFNTKEVLQNIKKYRPTLFPGVPTMYVAINNFPGVRKYNVRSIRACISGAAPLPIEVKERFEKLTKGKLVEGYGLSEASPVTHANPIHGRNKMGSIGLPLPSTEARIIDLKSGRPLPPGQIGELVIRGPQVMQGYWQNPAATRAVIDRKGWLRTNDVARMDEDGYFQIISRRQDMWQAEDAMPAFPRDVEEVVYELPEVREVVVIAIANRPIAFVSLKEGTRIPAKTIIEFCRRRLPPSQVPRLVIFVKDFPRSFIGKVLRRELVSQYEHEIEAEAGSVGEHLAGLSD
ncbi:MAG TPA: alpha/beta fold hydrolase [Anaerolineae bacterium]